MKKLNWDLGNKNVTLVSIHVRRTDYAKHLDDWYELSHVDVSYFQRAVDHFRQKFEVNF